MCAVISVDVDGAGVVIAVCRSERMEWSKSGVVRDDGRRRVAWARFVYREEWVGFVVMRVLSSVIALVRIVGDGLGVLRVWRITLSAERSSDDIVVVIVVDGVVEVDV